jgi:hypothetical protein
MKRIYADKIRAIKTRERGTLIFRKERICADKIRMIKTRKAERG